MNDIDIKQTIEFWESWLNQKKTTNIGEFMIYGGRSLDVCKKYLQEKAERENPKPLTLEQLKERIGKPVFVVGANPQKREWGIVHNGRDEYGGKITLRLDFHSLITLPINSKVKFYDHEPKEA